MAHPPSRSSSGSDYALEIELLSFWHPGTGRGDGAAADAVVHRGGDGLPILPGRTVKGLLRAAATLGVAAGGGLTAPDIVELFGSEVAAAKGGDRDPDARVKRLEEARYHTAPGQLRVGNAQLGRTHKEREAWAAFGRGDSARGGGRLAMLRRSFASTKLDELGVAADSTLRTIELYVPMTLYAPIRLESDRPREDLLPALGLCATLFLRSLGSHRTRGLGRCAAKLVEVSRG
jgi:hypothetical protein